MPDTDEKDLDELMQAAADGEEIGDDEVEIDLSEAETFEPFEAKVPVEIIGAAIKTGQESKKPYIELVLRVFEGEFQGRQLYTNIMLTGKGAGFAVDKLKAFDYTIDPEKPKVSVKALVGRKAMAKCAPDKREEYAHKVVVGKLSRYVGEAEAAAADLK